MEQVCVTKTSDGRYFEIESEARLHQSALDEIEREEKNKWEAITLLHNYGKDPSSHLDTYTIKVYYETNKLIIAGAVYTYSEFLILKPKYELIKHLL